MNENRNFLTNIHRPTISTDSTIYQRNSHSRPVLLFKWHDRPILQCHQPLLFSIGFQRFKSFCVLLFFFLPN